MLSFLKSLFRRRRKTALVFDPVIPAPRPMRLVPGKYPDNYGIVTHNEPPQLPPRRTPIYDPRHG